MVEMEQDEAKTLHTHGMFSTLRNMVYNVFSWPMVFVIDVLKQVYCRVTGLFESSRATFEDDYLSKYGTPHPKIFAGSFESAKAVSYREGKILAVYLHSDGGEGDEFCSKVLSGPLVIELMDANFVFYVEYVDGPRMRRLIGLTGANRLPHISFFYPVDLTHSKVIAKVENLSDIENFTAILIHCMESLKNPPETDLGSFIEESRRIRDEQNEEFRRAVAIDLLAIAKRNTEREAEEKRRKMSRNSKKLKLERRREIIEQRKLSAKNFEAVVLDGDTKIRVRLPSGATIESAFNKKDRVESIYQWVEVSEYINGGNKNFKIPFDFTLSIPYPSRVLLDKSITLEAASLTPNALLVLFSLDSDGTDEESDE